MTFFSQILSVICSDLPQKKQAIQWGSAFALCLFTLQLSSVGFLNADILDITIIPTDGKVGRAFATGDFSFEIILLYGMYLIKMIALMAGSIYVVMNVYAGIQFILSDWTGVATKEAGKNTMINAFIGFGITVFSWIILDLIISFVSTGA